MLVNSSIRPRTPSFERKSVKDRREHNLTCQDYPDDRSAAGGVWIGLPAPEEHGITHGEPALTGFKGHERILIEELPKLHMHRIAHDAAMQ